MLNLTDKKILIFSDTHLTHEFDHKKFKFLKRLISQYDQIIINGDFWDSSKTSFNKFINSDWAELFPLLKKKKAIYIEGNHDMISKMDDRVTHFCEEVMEKIKIQIDDTLFHIEHGHLLDSVTTFIADLIVKLGYLGRMIDFPINLIFRYEEWRAKRGRVYKYKNKRFRKLFDKILLDISDKVEKFEKHVLVMGHTHHPDSETFSNFINSGFIKNGFSSYVEIVNNQARLVKTQY